jgi:hypothetical protein
MTIYVLWGRPPRNESTPWNADGERFLAECQSREKAESLQRIAESRGWHSCRIAVMDMAVPPDFAGTIQF